MKLKVILVVLILIIPIISASVNQNNEVVLCKKGCYAEYKQAFSQCTASYNNCTKSCQSSNCRTDCVRERTSCVRGTGNLYKECQKNCIEINSRGCLNNTYKIGEVFTKECDKCQCSYGGKVSCKREAFCNKNTSINREECLQGKGLYLQLCNGPYFDIVCSKQNFCICKGIANYSCPADYECLTNFISPNKRTHTIGGWKDLLGKSLGEIGVCVK